MAATELRAGGADLRGAALAAENLMLRQEIRVAREAAEITARLVVQQFEKSEAMLERLQQSKAITETALRENKGIMDNASLGISFTRERKIFRYNKAFREMFGFSGESGIDQPGRALFCSDEDYDELGRLAGPLLTANKPFAHEMLMRRQDGREFWADLKAYVADPRDPSVGTVWIVQDRSAFKAAEEEVKRASEEMAAIFESSTFGIAFIRDRVMVKANHKLEELFGYAQGELCGRSTRCWYPDEESYRSVGVAYNELALGQTHRRVMTMQHKDGSLFWARLSGCALSADISRGSVWTVEDVTAEQEATAALQLAKEKAEAAEEKLRESYAEVEAANCRLVELDRMKSDFLSSVSHELRTPLTSIRGFARLIDREFSRTFLPLQGDDDSLRKKSQRIRDNLEIILKESERLTRLINDVLDLAKIEAGRIEWHDVPIPPQTLARDAANAVAGLFESKPEVALHLELQEDLPLIIGDADRLLQVLVNLLNNAAKFTDAGAVTLSVRNNAEQQIQMEVCDTGIGFPSDDAEAIFDKFQQAKHGDTLADRPAGTGLGLAISREIVSRHGGRIWARSEPGKGSVFTLTLPAAVPPQQTAASAVQSVDPTAAAASDPQRPAAERRASRVLVVDDDPNIRGYLTQLLQEYGYEVVAADDGRAALGAAQRFRPDLITMDLAMPVMDGRTAIVQLRADPQLQHIPIMVISAIPGWESAGGDLAMGKPLDEQRFLHNVHLLLGNDQGEASRRVSFLVLHEADELPASTLGGLSSRCELSGCPVAELPARIAAGFQGMVVVPTHLLGKVDLSELQATPALEVMIMPVRAAAGAGAGKHSRGE